jgi:1-pyrroline-5-carboxylate dehydrogenase
MSEDFIGETESLPMGDVTDFSNFMSAVIDEKSFTKQRDAIQRAESDDTVTVVAGGSVDDSQGWFMRPTILLCADPDGEIFTTEYFGPLLAVHVFHDSSYDKALRQMEAAAAYGLTGSIIAQDRQAIAETAELLRFAAGNFYINDKPTGAVVGSSRSAVGGPAAPTTRRALRRTCSPGPALEPSRKTSSRPPTGVIRTCHEIRT